MQEMLNVMIREKVDKILSYKSVSDSEKVDRLLELNSNQYTKLGIDSTKTQKIEVKSTSKYIFRAIKKLDESLGRLLLIDAQN